MKLLSNSQRKILFFYNYYYLVNISVTFSHCNQRAAQYHTLLHYKFRLLVSVSKNYYIIFSFFSNFKYSQLRNHLENLAKEDNITSLVEESIDRRREIVNRLLKIHDDGVDNSDDEDDDSKIVMEEFSRFQRLIFSGKKLMSDKSNKDFWADSESFVKSKPRKVVKTEKPISSSVSSSTSQSYKVQTSLFNFFSVKKQFLYSSLNSTNKLNKKHANF